MINYASLYSFCLYVYEEIVIIFINNNIIIIDLFCTHCQSKQHTGLFQCHKHSLIITIRMYITIHKRPKVILLLLYLCRLLVISKYHQATHDNVYYASNTNTHKLYMRMYIILVIAFNGPSFTSRSLFYTLVYVLL